MKSKKNTIIIIILCMIFLVLGTILGMMISDKLAAKNQTHEDNPSNSEVTPEKEKTPDDILDTITGEWGSCENESCQGVILGKNDKNEYIYTPYIMWSDGFMGGVITEVDKVESNIYYLTVHTEAYEGVESSAPEQTNKYKINISEASSNILYIDDVKFQKITTDREEFFNSKIK